MRYVKPTTFFCFSPLVMIVTFGIEVGLAGYVLWKYKLSAVSRVTVGILTCLALFQFAEYNVCEGSLLLDSAGWARVGYAAITLLPPLGIHLINRLSGDEQYGLVTLGYGLGGAFAVYFLLMTGGISAGACLGNYVIFEQGHNTGLWYGLYYYGLLMVGIFYALYRSKVVPKHVKSALGALIVGYLLFMVPTTLVNIVDPSTIVGIPSIMCGFAVLLAVIVVDQVLPHYYQHESLSERWKDVLKFVDATKKLRS